MDILATLQGIFGDVGVTIYLWTSLVIVVSSIIVWGGNKLAPFTKWAWDDIFFGKAVKPIAAVAKFFSLNVDTGAQKIAELQSVIEKLQKKKK